MKRVSFNLPNHAHYLTFSCYHGQKLLTHDEIRRALLVNWDEARHKGQFRIWAYVIMPEHVHLLLFPDNEYYKMSQILRLLKEPFTRWVVDHWRKEAPHLLEKIEARHGSRQVRRFWQQGGGYDRNLIDDVAIRKAFEYIEWNPVRRGLVDDPLEWPWSSARARAGASDSTLLIDEFVGEESKLGTKA